MVAVNIDDRFEVKKHLKRSFTKFLVLVLFLPGCGTLIHSNRQDISISTIPPDATVNVGNRTTKTPAKMSLPRTEDHLVLIEKEGYERVQVQLCRRFNSIASILGNILWIAPGLVVDFVVGGAWTLEPKTINVSLKELNKGTASREKQNNQSIEDSSNRESELGEKLTKQIFGGC